jgi:ribosomal protein S18 acetylase RimI-like enzyme
MLTIRPGLRADLAGVVALETAADTAMWLGETGLAWHERVLADPDQELLVAEDGGRLAGFAVLVGVHSEDRGIELRRMAVHPAMRGGGRGRGLLRAAVARARDEHAARRVLLDVKAHNDRARALYASEGFDVVCGPVKTMAEPDGSTSELLVMMLQVA